MKALQRSIVEDHESGVSPPLLLPAIADSEVAALVREIDKTGFAVVPDYVSSQMLTELRSTVMTLIESSGGEYVVLSGRDQIANTLLDTIGRTPRFIQLMHGLYEKACGKAAPQQSLYQVLRCLAGKTGQAQAYFFHYDSYVVTALLPIFIPTEGESGDLVIKPNYRRVRSSYLANVFDKVLVDNKYAQRFFRRNAIAQRGGFIKVKIIPGNLYLFWGYRSVHANEACDINKIRATALFHFGDPHIDSSLRKYTGRAAVRAKAEPIPDSVPA